MTELRTAIIHKYRGYVYLCCKGKDGAILIIASAPSDSISLQITDELEDKQRWIVNTHDKDGKITSHMFADYIQKGDY